MKYGDLMNKIMINPLRHCHPTGGGLYASRKKVASKTSTFDTQSIEPVTALPSLFLLNFQTHLVRTDGY